MSAEVSSAGGGAPGSSASNGAAVQSLGCEPFMAAHALTSVPPTGKCSRSDEWAVSRLLRIGWRNRPVASILRDKAAMCGADLTALESVTVSIGQADPAP
ncbi:hypothetical protein SAMN05216236_14217 [Sedimentitalea nanhaiensis]|uniref:Uncharacterized protein n=1 Tax=Sedimentitalea nanhaiensis TaxID=999627 RepID=A0A1I7E2T7_9RHOB|nr:hypothetical protein SAMN05216236_14217 [Sedimentitalea nanhaiensis]